MLLMVNTVVFLDVLGDFILQDLLLIKSLLIFDEWFILLLLFLNLECLWWLRYFITTAHKHG